MYRNFLSLSFFLGLASGVLLSKNENATSLSQIMALAAMSIFALGVGVILFVYRKKEVRRGLLLEDVGSYPTRTVRVAILLLPYMAGMGMGLILMWSLLNFA